MGLCRPGMSIGYVSDQLKRGPGDGFVGLVVYGIFFLVYGVYVTLIAAGVVALAGFIAAALAVMLPVSLLSAGVAASRQKKRQGQVAATRHTAQVVAAPETVSSLPPAPATAASLPPEAPLAMPKRTTQAWIEANVPNMSASTLGEFTSELRKRKWSDSDIATRVIPHAHIAKEIEELRGVVERLAAEIAEPSGVRGRGSRHPERGALP